jgi:hypothetical protein
MKQFHLNGLRRGEMCGDTLERRVQKSWKEAQLSVLCFQIRCTMSAEEVSLLSILFNSKTSD